MDEMSRLSSLCDDIRAHADVISAYTGCLGPNERRADAYAQDIIDLCVRIQDYIDESSCDEEDDDLT